MRAFVENPKKVFSKSAVLDYIENFVPDGEESSVSVHISNLRKKLEEASGEIISKRCGASVSASQKKNSKILNTPLKIYLPRIYISAL